MQAKQDTEANRLLKQLLAEMFEKGQIPDELLGETPLSKILDNPEGFLYPPMKADLLNDVDSFIRTQNYVQKMA